MSRVWFSLVCGMLGHIVIIHKKKCYCNRCGITFSTDRLRIKE